MADNNFTSIFSVLHVNDLGAAVDWYARWIGRQPDAAPNEDIAEWKLAENAWIQVSAAPDPSLSGQSFVVCGVRNIEIQRADCHKAGVISTEIENLGFVRLCQIKDPAGNTIVFVQEM